MFVNSTGRNVSGYHSSYQLPNYQQTISILISEENIRMYVIDQRNYKLILICEYKYIVCILDWTKASDCVSFESLFIKL